MCTAIGRAVRAESAGIASRMASAARTARSASLPWATGAPNTPMTQSPMCLSIGAAVLLDQAVGDARRSRRAGRAPPPRPAPARARCSRRGRRRAPPPAAARRAAPPRGRPGGYRLGRGRPQRRRRLEQPLPVAQRDAEILQVGVGQVGQDVEPDRVGARRARSYCLEPRPRSQAPTSTPVPLIGRARPDGCSLSRAAVERAMERHERSAFSLADRRQGGARRLRRRSPDLGRRGAGAGRDRAPARDRRAPGALPRRTRGRRSGCTTRWPR